MAINEDLVNVQQRHAVDILRLIAQQERQTQTVMDELEVLLQTQILNRDFGKRTETRLRRVGEFMDTVKPQIREAFRTLRDDNRELLVEASDTEVQFQNNSIAENLIAAGIGVLAVPNISREKVRADVNRMMIEGVPLSVWWERIAQDVTNNLQAGLNQALGSGTVNNNFDIIRLVFGDESTRFYEKMRRAVGNTVRTSIHRGINQAKILSYLVNPNIRGIQQISTFDSRTSPVCVAYGGKVWNKKYQPIGHSLPWNGGPPRHFNCRSTVAPVHNLTKPTPDANFETWLKKQDTDTQNDLLGPNRAGLFRDGKLPLAELVNQSGRPLTIMELKAKLNINN